MTDPALTVEKALSDELRAWLTEKLRYPVLAVLTDQGGAQPVGDVVRP